MTDYEKFIERQKNAHKQDVHTTFNIDFPANEREEKPIHWSLYLIAGLLLAMAGYWLTDHVHAFLGVPVKLIGILLIVSPILSISYGRES